jgi:hypothetical protein
VDLILLIHLRHTEATLVKNLEVPARDAQAVLGQSPTGPTREIQAYVEPKPSADCQDP